jgi:hypothetical protein
MTATSASETITICRPVGIPIRISVRSSFGSMFMCRTIDMSSASGFFSSAKATSRNASASAFAMIPAIAALTIPSCGRPNQPRMSAGVRIMISTVLTISARNGVRVSPVPRTNVVYARYGKKSGRERNHTRAYRSASS